MSCSTGACPSGTRRCWATRCSWPRSCRWRTPGDTDTRCEGEAVARDGAGLLGDGQLPGPAERYWNSFVIDGTVLVEPAPTALPNLRRCGFSVEAIEVVVISHFHADHCFGWPFFLEAAAEIGRHAARGGAAGLEQHLVDMVEVGKVRAVLDAAHQSLDLRFVEVDGTWQEAGPLRFRAVEVTPCRTCAASGRLRPVGGVVATVQNLLAHPIRRDRPANALRPFWPRQYGALFCAPRKDRLDIFLLPATLRLRAPDKKARASRR